MDIGVGGGVCIMAFKCWERIRIFTLFYTLGLRLFWYTMIVLELIKIVNQGITVLIMSYRIPGPIENMFYTTDPPKSELDCL